MATHFVGHQSMKALQQVLHQLGQKRIFLVRGGASYERCGAAALLNTIFQEEGIQVKEYTDVSPNPLIEEVERGVEALKASDAHLVLAVGGGSVMDAAKLMRHEAAEDGYHALLLAVATTAGTGAEVTRFSIVCKDGIKQSIQAEDILPDYAFVYPPFIYGISGYLAACTGFDALAHALESYWCRSANAESRDYAMKAIDLLWNNLPKVVHQPEPSLCDAVAEGSYWGGRAINVTKTTAPHAFSYAFTMKGNYPHGHAVALSFPYFFGLNLREDDPLVDHLGLSREVPLESQMRDYLNRIGLGYRGCCDCELGDLLSQVNLQKLQNNPVEMNAERMKSLEVSILKES